MRIRSVLIVASLGVLVACGGSESETEPSYAFNTAEEFFTAQSALEARMRCKAMFTCPAEQADMLLFYGRASDQEQCVEAVLGGELAAFERELLEGGRLAYDRAIGDACHKAWQGAEKWGLCDLNDIEASRLETSCEGVFTGTVKEAGNCLLDSECVEGLACEGEVSEDACYATCTAGPCGVCAEDEYCNGEACLSRLGENRLCLSTEQCQEGLFCNQETLKCEPSPPEPVEPEPELPMIVQLGQPCRDQGQIPMILCRPGTVCLPSDMEGQSTCQYPSKEGDPCLFDEYCAFGLSCDYDFDLDEGKCVIQQESGESLMCEVP